MEVARDELPKRERAFDGTAAFEIVAKHFPRRQRLRARHVLDGFPAANLAAGSCHVAVEDGALPAPVVSEAGELLHGRTPAVRRASASSQRAWRGTARLR